MKKRLLCLVTLMVLLISTSMTAFAKDIPTITFDGGKTLENGLESADFEDTFKGMLPGEERTQSIVLKNTDKNTVDYYMSMKILKAFEDFEQAAGAAYSVKLSVAQGEKETLIYGTGVDATTIGGVDGKGLYDLNGSLNDSFLVATLATGESATVKLSIAIDGESFGNGYNMVRSDVKEFQGITEFQFFVSYDDEVVATNESASQGTGVLGAEYGKTGDVSPITIYVIIGAVALIVILAAVVVRRRAKND